MSTYLNSTQPQLNFNSISPQPNFNLRFKSTSALTSTSTITLTQYGCDIKATQSCFSLFFCNQNQVCTTIGQKNDIYLITSKKIKPLALKCAKLECFRVKRHNFAENLPIQPKSRIFHHLNKNGSYSANFGGRPMFFSNETLSSIF